jgi:hypothetical protein
MGSSSYPVGLSEWVIGKKIEQRFGLIGIARLIKLVELVAERNAPATTAPSAVVAWGDFMAALHCNNEIATEFLAYCDHARVIDQGSEDGRLRLTLVGELAMRLACAEAVAAPPVGRLLFVTHQQWAEWFKAELSCPPYLVNDPVTLKLFRRWCATNVTVDEVEAAIERSKHAQEAPHPAALHDHMKALRLEKLRAIG